MKVLKSIIAIAILVLVTMCLFSTVLDPIDDESCYAATEETCSFSLSDIFTSIQLDYSDFTQTDEDFYKRNRAYVHSFLGLDTTDWHYQRAWIVRLEPAAHTSSTKYALLILSLSIFSLSRFLTLCLLSTPRLQINLLSLFLSKYENTTWENHYIPSLTIVISVFVSSQFIFLFSPSNTIL